MRNLRSNPKPIDVNMQTKRSRRIAGLLFFVSVVTYLDRVNISIVSPAIERELGLDKVQMGFVFSAFVVGYMAFQIPGGWLGDYFGHKKTLILCLIWWSLFTGLTPFADTLAPVLGLLGGLCLVRLFMGLGEAAAYPCSNALIGEWFAPRERSFISGIMFAGIGVGSAVTPPLIAWIVLTLGWRWAFYLSSIVGIVLAVALSYGIPEKYANRRVKRLATPWRAILQNPQVWLLFISIFFFGYVTYVYYFWLYPYLVTVRKIPLLQSSFFAAMPFALMAISAPLGGAISARMWSTVGKVRAHRRVAMTGLIAAAVLIPSGAIISNAYAAVTLLSLGAGSLYLAISSYFTAALDVFPEHGAIVSGTMNAGAGLGGVVAPVLTPYVANQFGWETTFGLAGLFAFLAALFWMLIGTPESGQEQSSRQGSES